MLGGWLLPTEGDASLEMEKLEQLELGGLFTKLLELKKQKHFLAKKILDSLTKKNAKL